MLIGGDDISNDIITLGTCFSMFVYILTRFCFVLIGGKSDTSVDSGATKELVVQEFKFQRHSCKLSFLPPPECPGELACRLFSLLPCLRKET